MRIFHTKHPIVNIDDEDEPPNKLINQNANRELILNASFKEKLHIHLHIKIAHGVK